MEYLLLDTLVKIIRDCPNEHPLGKVRNLTGRDKAIQLRDNSVVRVTKKVNGGDNELDDRIKYTKLFAKILNYENCTNHK